MTKSTEINHKHIILISGKDSLAAALIQREHEGFIDYEYVFNKTGWELPETLEWLTRIEVHFGKPILRLGDDLDEICREQNCLPLPFRRFCTKYAKIKPLNDYIGKQPCVLYFGLRADEPKRVGYVVPPRQQIVCRYPLRDHGLTINDVWKLCHAYGLAPPDFHWRWMDATVRERLGDRQWALDDLEPWVRAALLAWRTRNNCDRCFFMRKYEWIGLFEHHPDLFEAACHTEESLCHRDEHSWRLDGRLRLLPLQADAIKHDRAAQIVKHLEVARQGVLFDTGQDMLDVTSCGLLCGK